MLRLQDKAPISVPVVECDTINGVTIGCDDEIHYEESVLKSGYASYEGGYQYRFRPHKKFSFAPALLAGYQHALRGFRRVVECDGCPEGQPIDLDTKGGYLTGLLRITFGQLGFAGIMVRSQWFLDGDFRHITTCGLEAFAP